MPKAPISRLQLDNLICDPNPTPVINYHRWSNFYGAHNKLTVVPEGTPIKKFFMTPFFSVTPFGGDDPTTYADDPMFWR